MDQFTSDMLQGCLEVLTEMPGTVFKACDVLSAVALRNGEDWKETTMRLVLEQVSAALFALLGSLRNEDCDGDGDGDGNENATKQ